jgi:tRNA pseudouridine55 synthase
MNGVVIIDKPSGWTSHDVVGKLRGLLHERRIGHGGTLDPMATGVLPVFVGRGTRAVEFCENAQKQYIAGLKLGIVTDTQDTTGNIISSCDVSVTMDDVKNAAACFIGQQQQVPPMYSAVKVNGKKLYELARKGIEVERKSRSITIYNITASGSVPEDITLDITCSKGTYVRTICHDIGQKLLCGGAMSSLRRVRAGNFGIDNAYTIEQVTDMISAGDTSFLLPVDSLFSNLPAMTVTQPQEKRCRCGGDFKCGCPDGQYRVYSNDGEFLMLGACSGGNMKTIKSFFEV